MMCVSYKLSSSWQGGLESPAFLVKALLRRPIRGVYLIPLPRGGCTVLPDSLCPSPQAAILTLSGS